ncbi:MAG: Bax inhibitor-1/YccA family protein [Alphaproteobacteria bacterium]|nr:Bax inhibitor-1/YccA family protein [Alphaproteobacteria bacterium]
MQNYEILGLNDVQSVGMRSYFGRIYNYMAGGLLVSAGTAYLAVREPFFSLFYSVQNNNLGLSLFGWMAVLAPLMMIFMINSAVAKMNAAKASVLFWIFSALMGVSLSNVLLMYTGDSIVQSFLVTAAGFLGLSLYGYTTKKSLASWGSFLMMGLVGVIAAMLINIFLKSSALSLGLSIISVFIFIGLTIYDTNRLKSMYYEGMSEEAQKAVAINGALALYLDFINLFRLVLYFLGDRR